MGIEIISFDGLNRSGKGTQLNLTKKYLENRIQNVRVVRGDGSREGIGNPQYFDPPSIWWKKWQNNKEKTTVDWDNAYSVLNKENEEELKKFSHFFDNGFFLMDRCYISRWFVERQRDKNTKIEDIIKNTQIIPDKYFILDAPKEELLSRQNDDNPNKAQFRREIIEQWYDLWQDTINRAQEKLKDKIIRIDATQNKYDIHQRVIRNIEYIDKQKLK